MSLTLCSILCMYFPLLFCISGLKHLPASQRASGPQGSLVAWWPYGSERRSLGDGSRLARLPREEETGQREGLRGGGSTDSRAGWRRANGSMRGIGFVFRRAGLFSSIRASFYASAATNSGICNLLFDIALSYQTTCYAEMSVTYLVLWGRLNSRSYPFSWSGT